MQPQQNFNGSGYGEQSAIVCSQCGSPMPQGMRFCRTCGNRLGDGPAEYTETVRFPNANAVRPAGTSPFYPNVNAPISRQAFTGVQGRRRRLGFTGMTWMWIGLGLFFAVGGATGALFKGTHRSRPAIVTPSNRSYFGVNGFDTTDGGATFDVVEPPGGPADKAGLVGGDIITSFDHSTIREDDDIMDVLRHTPVGKTVDVVFLRDGAVHNTQLTTVSQEEYNRLDREYNSRSEGKGMFGFESNRMTRIKNAETKTFGVRIDYVEPNGPADLFGIKAGDIITDFDNVPIRTADEFLSRVRRAKPYTTVNIGLLHDGKPAVIPVKIGKAR